MNKSLLGPYIQQVPNVPVMREWLHRVKPKAVLTMQSETCEAILGRRPADWNPIVIGRVHFEVQNQALINPRLVAQSIAEGPWGDLCHKGIVTHMMIYNEIDPHHGRWQKYVPWQTEAVDELAWYDIKYLAGNWSVGQPDELYWRCTTATCGFGCAYGDGGQCPNCGAVLEKRIVYWDDPRVHRLMRIIVQHNGLLGLHQYLAPTMADGRDFDPPTLNPWDPTIDTSWRILRHRKARKQLLDYLSPEEIPDFLISECGLEAGAVPWPIPGVAQGVLAGWNAMCSPEAYMDGLQWYDWQCRHDPYIKGLLVFLMGGYEDWSSHDVWDIREKFGEAIRKPLPIEEEPEPEPEPVDEIEDWIVNELMAGGWTRENELPFVPTNYIEALGLRMGWIPVSDEIEFWPLEDTAAAYLKVFVAPLLRGGYCKKVVWWYAGDWENYKVITVQL